MSLVRSLIRLTNILGRNASFWLPFSYNGRLNCFVKRRIEKAMPMTQNQPMTRLFPAFVKKMGLPLLLFAILVLPLFLGSYVSAPVKAFFYSFSLSMKAILLFLLPFIIFSFVFSAIMNLKSGVFKFILALISMIFISNCAAIFTGFTVGSLVLPKLAIAAHVQNESVLLAPLWTLNIKNWIPNQYALIAGFVLGIIFSFRRVPVAEKIARKLNLYANMFLKKVFIPLLPLFILGFVCKLEHDALLAKALRTYGPVFLLLWVRKFLIYCFCIYVLQNSLCQPFLNISKMCYPQQLPDLVHYQVQHQCRCLFYVPRRTYRNPP